MNQDANNQRNDLEVLWTPVQMAKYLSLKPVTIYKWLSSGRMIDPAKVVRLGKRVRIPRSEVVRIAGTTRDTLLNQ